MAKVFIERENKQLEVDASTALQLLEKLNINPTTVIITKNNNIITETSLISKEDKIKIIPVISGG